MLITVNRVIKRLTLFTNTVQGLLEERDLQARNQTREAGGGSLPCPFSKFKEKCPDFGKKCPH